jgi:hypothetical protein
VPPVEPDEVAGPQSADLLRLRLAELKLLEVVLDLDRKRLGPRVAELVGLRVREVRGHLEVRLVAGQPEARRQRRNRINDSGPVRGGF